MSHVERAALACMILDNDLIPLSVDVLEAGYFTEPRHQILYEAIHSLYEDTGAVDEISLYHWLGKRDELGKMGGATYLSGMSNDLPGLENFERYADSLHEEAVRRNLTAQAAEIVKAARNTKRDAREILAEQQERMSLLQGERDAEGLRHVEEAMDDSAEALSKPPGTTDGIKTGFASLDRVLQGWAPGQLIYLAARPGMGKSALGIQFGLSASKRGMHAAVFSLEMTRRELGNRMLSSETSILHDRIRGNYLHDNERERCQDAVKGLSEAPLWIDDSADMTVAQMHARALRLKRDKGLDLLIIDYIQLINPGQRFGSENETVTAISRSLKVMAKRLECPVIALSQLSRNVEHRSDKRPALSDLRASGSLEQDADVVLFIYRPAYYGESSEESELIVAKQRAGKCGTIGLHFNGPCMRFTESAKREGF